MENKMQNVNLETMSKEDILLEHKILENFVRKIAYTNNSSQYFKAGTAKVIAQETLERIHHIRKSRSI